MIGEERDITKCLGFVRICVDFPICRTVTRALAKRSFCVLCFVCLNVW